jgi:hypothetical protein
MGKELNASYLHNNIKDIQMETFSTCLVKVLHCSNDPKATLSELLSELEQAIDSHAYEIVCMGNGHGFSLSDAEYGSGFTTLIQFNFPRPLPGLEAIEQEIRLQIEGACSIDVLQANDHCRLLQIEKCEISFI